MPPDDGGDPTHDCRRGRASRSDNVDRGDRRSGGKAHPRPGSGADSRGRYRIAWFYHQRPAATAPVPTVLTDRHALRRGGHARSPARFCPGCGRVIRPHRPIGGKWLCHHLHRQITGPQPCTAGGSARPLPRRTRSAFVSRLPDRRSDQSGSLRRMPPTSTRSVHRARPALPSCRPRQGRAVRDLPPHRSVTSR